MKYCPLMSFQKQYHEKEKCLGEDCAFAADAAGNCLVKQALQCYISKERTAAAEQESAEHYWMMKKDGTRTPVVFNGETNYSPSSGYPYTMEPSSNCIITPNDFVGYGGLQEGS